MVTRRRVIGLRVDPETYNLLHEYANKLEVTPSYLAWLIIWAFLHAENEGEVVQALEQLLEYARDVCKPKPRRRR